MVLHKYDLNERRPLPSVVKVRYDTLPDRLAKICKDNRIELYLVRGGPNMKIWPASGVVADAIDRIERGKHPPTKKIADSTSGNFALGEADALEEVRKLDSGVPLETVVAVVPKTLQKSKIALLEARGIEVVSAEDQFEAMELAARLAKENGWYYAGQYWNKANYRAYERMAKDLPRKVPKMRILAAGVGSGGLFYEHARIAKKMLAPLEVYRIAVGVAAGESVGGVRTDVGLQLNGKPGFAWRRYASDTQWVGLELSIRASAGLWPQGIFCGESTGLGLVGGLHGVLKLGEGAKNELRDDEGNLQFVFFEHDHRDPYRDDYARFGITW